MGGNVPCATGQLHILSLVHWNRAYTRPAGTAVLSWVPSGMYIVSSDSMVHGYEAALGGADSFLAIRSSHVVPMGAAWTAGVGRRCFLACLSRLHTAGWGAGCMGPPVPDGREAWGSVPCGPLQALG